jgi:transcriptional regulator with XRE-family HTH domain
MINTINERIEALILHLAKGKQTEFAAKIGVPQSTIAGIVGIRQTKPGYEILEKIAIAFPEVNSDWLLIGEGEMFRDALPSKPADGGEFGKEVIDRLLKIIEELNQKDKEKDETIRSLSMTLGKLPASENAYYQAA